MPTKPTIKTLTNSSVDILNVIRHNATQNYQYYVPKATPDADSIRRIGAIIMDYPGLQNEFLSALINRIGRVLLTSKMYDNPWAMFKKGMLEFGETIEEIFVNIAKPHTFDQEIAEKEVFKREIPDVKSAFHIMNYQKFYKATISNDQLRQAFLSWEGISNLIAKIVDALYTGANYDEFLTMKYLIARNILDGRMNPVQIAPVGKDSMGDIVTTIKGISNSFEFLSSNYNPAGVYTHTKKEDQFVLLNSLFEARMNVDVLASAFNMDKVEFSGHMILVDSFGSLDEKRLKVLFAGDTTFKMPTVEELKALDAIPAIIVDRDWFMIFDNYNNFTEQYNGQGLYWNYWYHVWKTFSTSPFANNALFVPGTPAVNTVTVSPSAVNASINQTVQFNAVVETTLFAPKTVTWSVNSENATVDSSGKVTLLQGASGSIVVTATSTFNNEKTGTATITVA